jgi:hypothetical protein
VFLVNAFQGNTELADSINHLLVVGFYLVNLGYVALALRTYAMVDTPRQVIELLSDKVGMILVVLGIMHFLNLYVFNRCAGAATNRRCLRPCRRMCASSPDPSCGAVDDLFVRCVRLAVRDLHRAQSVAESAIRLYRASFRGNGF